MSFVAKKRFSLMQTLGIVAASSVLHAMVTFAVEIPHAFVPNTTARASEVNANFQALANAVSALEDKLRYLAVVDGPLNGVPGPHVIVEGANLHVRSGAGATDDGCEDGACLVGRGNLIIGYNELGAALSRGGSHNLVVGRGHDFPSYGSFVAGESNAVNQPFSSVTGGQDNVANGTFSTVGAGQFNEASAAWASVAGGFQNQAAGPWAAVAGGRLNGAIGAQSAVGGGAANSAMGAVSSIHGGRSNVASGDFSTVSAGRENSATGEDSAVAGGNLNVAAEIYSTVAGDAGRTYVDDAVVH